MPNLPEYMVSQHLQTLRPRRALNTPLSLAQSLKQNYPAHHDKQLKKLLLKFNTTPFHDIYIIEIY